MGEDAAPACGLRGGQPVPVEDLNDLDYGDWQWKTYEEVKEQCPKLYARWFSLPHLVRFPNGELLQDIVLRSANILRRITEELPEGTVVLVGHDSVNRALLLQILDQPISAYSRVAKDPCAINVITFEEDRIRILSLNDTGHIHP